jgi:uncharacterized protein
MLVIQENTFVPRLGRFVTKHPWWVIFLTLFLVIAASAGLKNIEFTNNYRIFFGKENPQLLAFDALQNTYSKSDNLMFVVEPENGEIFTRETLQAIVELTKEGWQLPYSSRVDSITNFQHTVAIEDDLIVEDLVVDPVSLTDAELRRIKQIALQEPLLNNRLVSPSGHVAGVNVTVQLPGVHPIETMEIAAAAREIAAQITQRHPNIKIHLTGIVMLNNAFGEAAFGDTKTLLPIMYGIVIFMLIVCLRSFSGTFSVVILMICSILAGIGVGIWFGIKMTPVSSTAPTIILTMAVADCVHFLVTMLHNMRLGHEKKQAIQESLRINFQPIFLTSATTAIGFLSMNFSDAPPFQNLGNLVAAGVTFAFFLSVTLLPALMTVLPVKTKQQDELDNSYMKSLAEFVIRRRKFLLAGNALLAVGLISLVPLNQINDEFVKYFDETVEFRRATDFLNENMGGIYSIEYALDAGETGAISEPVFLQQVDNLKEWLLKQPEVVHVNTITDTFKRLNKNMHGDSSEWYKLPEQRDLASQYLLLYEMSLPYGLDLNDQINLDKSAIRVIATMHSLSTEQMLDIERRVNAWLKKNMQGIEVKGASPVLMFSHIGKRNAIRMLIGTMAALVLISLLLIAAFRSLKLGLLSLIPNLVPAGMAFGIWALIDGNIGLSLSVVTGMTLGIVVDDTVHFISKYRRARIEHGYSSEDAVRYAFSTVGVALWITSAVLICGFIVLSTSHFTMNNGMGLMTAITIAIALFMDFLLLPPLLMSLDKK